MPIGNTDRPQLQSDDESVGRDGRTKEEQKINILQTREVVGRLLKMLEEVTEAIVRLRR